ncbi:MAG TPA: hypothetical protein VFW94_24405 [Candidatus Acidoferrales bacterium]|nr:hypothetical protein [Candidatus Acidoferrales bacterium]
MPWLKALPTWMAVNNCNFSSPTALTDAYTGQPYTGGALNVGDYTDIEGDDLAKSVSNLANGILYSGRYRFVQVDSSATAANVKTGTIGYLRNGYRVDSVRILTAGTGQTNGTYTISGTGGGGSGASVTIVISGGAITSAVVASSGSGYVTAPTFTVAQGGTPGTLGAQLNSTMNVVTSADQAVAGFGPGTAKAVVFLNAVTPGNYGFVQELGIATVLGTGTIGAGNSPGGYANLASTNDGTVSTTAATGSPIGTTVGRAIDTPIASNLFKIVITQPTVQG